MYHQRSREGGLGIVGSSLLMVVCIRDVLVLVIRDAARSAGCAEAHNIENRIGLVTIEAFNGFRRVYVNLKYFIAGMNEQRLTRLRCIAKCFREFTTGSNMNHLAFSGHSIVLRDPEIAVHGVADQLRLLL
jgi:hypothetical protein